MFKSRRDKVEAAIKDLMIIYELGESLNKEFGIDKPIPKDRMDQFSKKRSINTETARKGRQFAAEYPSQEREKLFQRIRQDQYPQEVGAPVFGKTHLGRILTVEKDKREKILARALKDCWGLTTLEDEIGKQFGNRKQAGRRIKAPKSFSDFLIRLDSLCESWRRLKNGITGPPKKATGKQWSWDELPPNFQSEFQKISDQLLSFHKEVEANLKGFAKGRIPRLALENDGKKEEANPVKG